MIEHVRPRADGDRRAGVAELPKTRFRLAGQSQIIPGKPPTRFVTNR
jgi:hypothetical protein